MTNLVGRIAERLTAANIPFTDITVVQGEVTVHMTENNQTTYGEAVAAIVLAEKNRQLPPELDVLRMMQIDINLVILVVFDIINSNPTLQMSERTRALLTDFMNRFTALMARHQG